MLQAIEALLSLISGLLPSIGVGSTTVVAKIIEALVMVVPIIANNLPNLLASVKNIIAALQTSGAVTDEQMAQLAALDAQVDAAFETAATAAGDGN